MLNPLRVAYCFNVFYRANPPGVYQPHIGSAWWMNVALVSSSPGLHECVMVTMSTLQHYTSLKRCVRVVCDMASVGNDS